MTPVSSRERKPPSGHQHADLARWSHTLFGDHNFTSERGFFSWWYQRTAPLDPPPGSSFQLRDRTRRGRTASVLMLGLAVILLTVACIGLIGPNKQIALTALIVWVIIGLCLFLNRKGHVNLAGVLLTISVNGGMYSSIFREPGGLSLDGKDILYLLIFAQMIIGAILPTNWVFVVALLNFLVSFLLLTYFPHTPALDAHLATSYPIILLRLFQLHAIATIITWSLAKVAQQSVLRADRAEHTARLEHDLAQMKAQEAEAGQQLKTTTENIENTLRRVAQQDLDARVPVLPQGDRFWPLVGTLNTFLARYQRARQAEQERDLLRDQQHKAALAIRTTKQLEHEYQMLKETLATALATNQPVQLPASLRMIEPAVRSLNGKRLLPTTHLTPFTRD